MAHVTMASPAVWSVGDGVFVALAGLWRELSARQGGERTRGAQDSASIPRLRSRPSGALRSPATAESPIVTTTDGRANPIVFIVGADADNRLYAFRGDTGELIASPPEHMRGFHRYETLIAAGDRLYVASGGQAYAFGF